MSTNQGAMSTNEGAMSANEGAMSAKEGAMSAKEGAMSAKEGSIGATHRAMTADQDAARPDHAAPPAPSHAATPETDPHTPPQRPRTAARRGLGFLFDTPARRGMLMHHAIPAGGPAGGKREFFQGTRGVTMSMQTVFGRVVGSVRCGLGTAAMLAAVGLSGVGAVGIGTAHAQECDPAEVAKLLADDGAANDAFGRSVSISGDTAVIGMSADDDNGANSGSAYIFTRGDGVWTQQAKLLPADSEAGDSFGYSVSISGDTALIGAWGDDDNGSGSGAAYVYTRNGEVWTEQAKLLATDGASGDNFGISVSISGESALIGAYYDDDFGHLSGSAYVFTRISGLWWIEKAKLLPADGAWGDRFGQSVSLCGETALVGAYLDDDYGEDSGSAYVFSGNGGIWTQQAKLLPADGVEDAQFGWAVSVSGQMILIGARRDDDNGSAAGSAYVFITDGGVWTEQAKLLPMDGTAGEYFGDSVAICGETALIGAYENNNSNGSDSGAAYVFTRIGGHWWIEKAKLLASDGAADDRFGDSVSLSGEAVLIGATADDDSGYGSGSAYVFDLGCPDCPADLNGDGVVNTQDFLAFLGAWSSGDPLADWDGNGTINTLDFLAYLTDWTAGC